MTSEAVYREALVEIGQLHEPYLPQTLSVRSLDPTDPDYNAGEWHDPTVEEQAAALILWCDGCNREASRCTTQALVELALEGIPDNPGPVVRWDS